MLRELPWEKFLEWKEYFNLQDKEEMNGRQRGDWHAASICAAVMNGLFMTMTRSRKRWRVSDFLLKFSDSEKEIKKPQTWQQMKFIAQMCVAQANAEEKLREKKRQQRQRRK